MLSRIGRSSGQQIGVTGVTASRSSWGIEALDSFGCIQNTPRCGDAVVVCLAGAWLEADSNYPTH